jgi:hypothetical protein
LAHLALPLPAFALCKPYVLRPLPPFPPNQAIVDLARSVDPTGGRTIGVLTKPDTIESGTHDQWVPILKGDKFSLSLGYYAVRNMSQTDLNSGMSLEVSRVAKHGAGCPHRLIEWLSRHRCLVPLVWHCKSTQAANWGLIQVCVRVQQLSSQDQDA